MGNLLASGSVLAAFFAGGVALFAPCCIVFLAPGFLALAARNHRWRLLPLTFVFTAGGCGCLEESLREYLHLSERQLEKRFNQTVGISPQLYIRIKRVNEAFKLMDTGKYERLVDIAYELNFYDQSHFIRDIKAFSGLTPKGISQRVDDFHHDLVGSSYVYR